MPGLTVLKLTDNPNNSGAEIRVTELVKLPDPKEVMANRAVIIKEVMNRQEEIMVREEVELQAEEGVIPVTDNREGEETLTEVVEWAAAPETITVAQEAVMVETPAQEAAVAAEVIMPAEEEDLAVEVREEPVVMEVPEVVTEEAKEVMEVCYLLFFF